MPRFAANLSLLFTEVPLLDRFAAARAAGFAAVEMQFPYAETKAALAARRAEAGLPLVLHNLPPGDWAAGERGIAILPDRVAEFREGVARAIDYAGALGCRQINGLAGLAPAGIERARLLATLTENLADAADALGRAGLRLLIEPINDRDMPGFFLNRLADAASVIEAVDSENLFIQADLYHRAMMGEDLLTDLATHRSRIAHVQIADAPGRHEPGTGSIDVPAVLSALDGRGLRRLRIPARGPHGSGSRLDGGLPLKVPGSRRGHPFGGVPGRRPGIFPGLRPGPYDTVSA